MIQERMSVTCLHEDMLMESNHVSSSQSTGFNFLYNPYVSEKFI